MLIQLQSLRDQRINPAQLPAGTRVLEPAGTGAYQRHSTQLRRAANDVQHLALRSPSVAPLLLLLPLLTTEGSYLGFALGVLMIRQAHDVTTDPTLAMLQSAQSVAHSTMGEQNRSFLLLHGWQRHTTVRPHTTITRIIRLRQASGAHDSAALVGASWGVISS